MAQVNEKGQVVAKSPLLKELGSLEEEAGVKCCICLEGYKNHPQKVGMATKYIANSWQDLCRRSGVLKLTGIPISVHYTCTMYL